MKASELTNAEMRKEIRRLNKNLKRRIANIEKISGNASLVAVKQYRELKPELANMSNLNRRELTTLYRDIRYINTLKSSTVRGATAITAKAQELADKLQLYGEYQTIRDVFGSTSKTIVDILTEAYSKFADLTSQQLADQFKYEIWGTAVDYAYMGQTAEDIAIRLNELYETIVEGEGSGESDEVIKKLFTSKLRSIFK